MLANPGICTSVFLFCASCSLLGFTLYGVAGEMDSVAVLDLNHVKDEADLVLVGNLEFVPPPFEVLGKDFYKIKPQEVLKGKLTEKGLLSVVTNVDSSYGTPPTVEPKITYILFLRKVKLEDEGTPPELVTYCLVGNWKGIISLDKVTFEARAVRNIEKHYGVNIQDRAQDFREAMRYSMEKQSEGTAHTESKLSDGAHEIYNSLKLRK